MLQYWFSLNYYYYLTAQFVTLRSNGAIPERIKLNAVVSICGVTCLVLLRYSSTKTFGANFNMVCSPHPVGNFMMESSPLPSMTFATTGPIKFPIYR